MKTLTLVGIISTVLIGLAVIYFVFRTPSVEPTPITGGQYPGYQSTVTVPGRGTVTPGIATTTDTGHYVEVNAQTEGSVRVNDFISSKTTVKDEYNEGVYYLSGANDDAPYTISYMVKDSSFTVSIFNEPIGEVRRAAEIDLLTQLGITEPEACYLRYVVLVPASVNAIYAGKNLGFSFCPGATQL